MKKLLKYLPWLALIVSTVALLGYFLGVAKVQLGGDIVEYYGITESLINHQGFNLTSEDRSNLEQVLHKAYFTDPGYYITGRGEERYPVHFVFYSILATPVRLLLRLFSLPEIKTLWVTNILIFTATMAVLFKCYVKKAGQRLLLLALFLLSPAISFFVWPGPDLFYVCLLLLSVFAFFKKQFIPAIILSAAASWHSQPLIMITAGYALYAFIQKSYVALHNFEVTFKANIRALITYGLVSLAAFVPYLYNLFAFGVLTPWTLLKDGWTLLYGFGWHNLSLWKLFEQFFDLNMGLFWYAPLLLVFGVALAAIKGIKEKQYWFALGLIVLTAFFYQTNPGWHYGTSGFGPTRHILFVIPFLLYFVVTHFKPHRWLQLAAITLIATQLITSSLNNFLEPNLTDTLKHSPQARFVLNNYPQLYNPTPEIFFDRTNETDITKPTSAIYKHNGVCKKAYILSTEAELLRQECGEIPAGFEEVLDNKFTRITNYQRQATIYEATLWPEPESCAEYFQPTDAKPFVCLKTIADVQEVTGIKDRNRITTLPDFPYTGIWKIKPGDPIEITLPPGYIMHHHGIEGEYVTFKN